MPTWRESQERGTLRVSALTGLQFSQNPQMQKHGKSALEIPEIEQGTSGWPGTVPVFCPTVEFDCLPSYLQGVQVGIINYMLTLEFCCNFILCELGY